MSPAPTKRRPCTSHVAGAVARWRRASAPSVLALVLAATLLSCGSKERGLSDQAAAELQAGAAKVRSAAAAGDRTGATGALAALRGAVDRYRGQGQISAGRAAEVLAAAGEVEARLTLLAPPPTVPAPAPTTTTTARRAPSEPGGGGDEKDEEDRGKRGIGKKEED